MKKAILIGIAILFVNFLINDAKAEVDLETIDVKILDVNLEQFEIGYQKNSDLIIIKLNFTNNGESNYELKNAKNLAVLVLAPPNASSDEVTSKTKSNILAYYEYVDYDTLQIKFDDHPGLGKECEWIDFELGSQESKIITICYELPITPTRSNTKRIDDNQYFFTLDTSVFSSSCPNCKAISLKDVVKPPIEKTPKN